MVGWVLDRLRDVIKPGKPSHAPHILPSHKPTWRKHRGEGIDGWIKTSLFRWRDTRALLTLLSAAVVADLQTHGNESAVVGALIFRSRTLRRLDLDERDELIKIVRKDLALEDHDAMPTTKREAERINDLRWKAVEKASRSFRVTPERRKSVFLQVLDILHADQELVAAEKQFLEELRKMLGLDESDAARCARLIEEKNLA